MVDQQTSIVIPRVILAGLIKNESVLEADSKLDI